MPQKQAIGRLIKHQYPATGLLFPLLLLDWKQQIIKLYSIG
jgi:hypothetical protein